MSFIISLPKTKKNTDKKRNHGIATSLYIMDGRKIGEEKQKTTNTVGKSGIFLISEYANPIAQRKRKEIPKSMPRKNAKPTIVKETDQKATSTVRNNFGRSAAKLFPFFMSWKRSLQSFWSMPETAMKKDPASAMKGGLSPKILKLANVRKHVSEQTTRRKDFSNRIEFLFLIKLIKINFLQYTEKPPYVTRNPSPFGVIFLRAGTSRGHASSQCNTSSHIR